MDRNKKTATAGGIIGGLVIASVLVLIGTQNKITTKEGVQAPATTFPIQDEDCD